MIKRNSIQFRLYDAYSNGCVWDLDHGRVNFCQYSRKVGLGVLSVLGIILGLSFLLLGPLQVLGTVGLWLFTDNPWIPFIGQAFPFGERITGGDWLTGMGVAAYLALCIETIVFVVASICIISDKYVEYKSNRPESEVEMSLETDPGFFTTWYRSWKDKFCPIMELEKEDDTTPKTLKMWFLSLRNKYRPIITLEKEDDSA